MKLYKGFDKELKCRGFQYEVGKDYEETEAVLCESGFHACENPLDVFRYYPPAESRYCEVELDGISEDTSDDSKRCGKKIHIGSEIKLEELISAGAKFILNEANWKDSTVEVGDYNAATNTGDRSAAWVEGKSSVAIVTGYDSKVNGALGCAIVAVERGKWDGETYPLLSIKSAIVDGEKINADTFYKVINGEFVEAGD